MSSSFSLNNGTRFNKQLQLLQEGMQVIDPSNTDETIIKNTEVAVQLVSKNRDSEQNIQEKYKESVDTFQTLITEFDTVKNQLTQRINDYINRTGSSTAANNTNMINNGGINVIVTDVDTVKLSDIKFEGCYTDKQDRAIQNMQTDGYVFDVNACAQRAMDNGDSLFGVQNVNTNGLAQCFTGSDLDSATKYGYAYQKEQTWQSNTANKNIKTLLLNLNGNITLHDDSFLTSTKTKDVYIGNSYRDNVKKIELDRIGMTIGTKPTNTQNPSWRDTFSVNNDGKTLSVRRTDATTGWGQNLHLEGSFSDVTNVVWSSETNDKNDTFGCPTYFMPSDDFTSNDAKYCSGYRLIMQDDGNLVITNKNKTVIWSSGTNKPGKIAVDEWRSGTYRGRDYLNAGESITTGQWIASKNGATIAILEDNGNFSIYRSVYPCKSINGQTYGSSYSNAVYSVPKTASENLGSMIYLDRDTNKTYSYPNFIDNTYDLQDNKFILIGNYNSYDQDLSSFSTSSIEECETAASKVPECGGFIYNKKQQRCFLKGKKIWPKSQRVLDNDCVMKIKAPKVDVDASCPTDFITASSSNFELYPKSSDVMNNTMKCGLGRVISDNKPPYDKENTLLMGELTSIIDKINALSQERALNLETMPKLRNKIKSRYEEYGRLKKEYDTYYNRTLDPTLSQYKQDSELKRTMYTMDTTMLALLGIGGLLITMRLMK